MEHQNNSAIYAASAHLDVKMKQDRSDDRGSRLVLCDGVGEFTYSHEAAEEVINCLAFMEEYSQNELLERIKQAKNSLLQSSVKGATTLLLADYGHYPTTGAVHLAYIGNGAIYHFPGDVLDVGAAMGEGWQPYRYTNLMMPHVDKTGALTRCIAGHASERESAPSCLDVHLNGESGDAILLMTDGIATLENDFVLRDEQSRTWQLKSTLAHELICGIARWVSKAENITHKNLRQHLQETLMEFKRKGLLEDDVAVGLILTEPFIQHCRKKYE